jgi:hypothetical protein
VNRGISAALATCLLCFGLTVVLQDILPYEKFADGIAPRFFHTLGFALLFVSASFCGGAFFVSKLTAQKENHDAFWALSFCTGALAFTLVVGWLAWASLLNQTELVVPLLFILLGLPSVVRRFSLRYRSAITSSQLPLLMFGGACVALLAVQLLHPDNVNHDARWYHLRAAERYAMAGSFVRTPEGDQLLALPQLSSWLYTWAFLHKFPIDEKVRLCFMLEFSAYLGTAALIASLVRRLLPTATIQDTAATWVALFLFPSIFIYDTGTMGGSDHVVAFWALSSVVCWFDARQSTNWKPWVLFGLHLCGLLAKYSSLYLLVGFVPMVLLDAWIRTSQSKQGSFRRPKAHAFWLLSVMAATTVVLSMPYWLKHIIWYHNPVYPLANSFFPSTPWNPDVGAWMAFYKDSEWSNDGSWQNRFAETGKAMVNFQTRPYTWAHFVQGQPIFGFSYGVALCALVFVREFQRRLWMLVVLIQIGIAVWFNTHQHHMRYLTVLMPLMASIAAAVAVSLVKSFGFAGRISVAVVVMAHLILYADVPFRKTHNAYHESTIGLGVSYVESRGPQSVQLNSLSALDALPPHAVVLIHGSFVALGLPRQTVSDFVSLQFGINYSYWGSQAEILKQLRLMGVTHLFWPATSEQVDSIGGEALFLGLAHQTLEQTTIAGHRVGELPNEVREIGDLILYGGCDRALHETGLYSLKALSSPAVPRDHPWPTFEHEKVPAGKDWRSLLNKASYVVLEPTCGSLDDANFEFVATQAGLPVSLRYFLRVTGRAE